MIEGIYSGVRYLGKKRKPGKCKEGNRGVWKGV